MSPVNDGLNALPTEPPRRFARYRIVLLVLVIGAGVIGADRILGSGASSITAAARPDWPDSSDTNARLGRVPRPSVTVETIYRDNREGYLRVEGLRAKSWELHVMPGSAAELVLPLGEPELLRIPITKADKDTTWHVQLLQARYEVEARVPYFISFRARAERSRSIAIGFIQNHPPYAQLGLYQELALTPAWKSFREVFVARRADSNSAIAFNLAGSDISVELDSVTFHGPPAGRRIDPLVDTPRFSVVERRNSLGCRDRDYSAPAPDGTRRILLLGDGFTTGLGVHAEDTFARLLDRDLKGGPSLDTRRPVYEVINCGVSGYGTHEQRLFFETLGEAYRPDLVLVTMRWNDDRFYWEEDLRERLERGPSRLGRLSSIVRRIEASRNLARTYHYRRCVDDLLALDKEVAARRGRLIVAVSREGPDGLADSLLATVRRGLEGTAIPLLDLGRLDGNDSLGARGYPDHRGHRVAATELSRWIREGFPTGPRD